jgi:hypothetical protein
VTNEKGKITETIPRRAWVPMSVTRVGSFGDVLRGATGDMMDGATMKD